jgi:hypothetical protein
MSKKFYFFFINVFSNLHLKYIIQEFFSIKFNHKTFFYDPLLPLNCKLYKLNKIRNIGYNKGTYQSPRFL